MSECNGCGSCCDPVVMPYSQQEAFGYSPAVMAPENRRWVLEDLTPITYVEALVREPWLKQVVPQLVAQNQTLSFFRCRHFDEVTRLCINYAGRPPICRGWPWRNGLPNPHMALPPTCSFRADIGQPVEIRPR